MDVGEHLGQLERDGVRLADSATDLTAAVPPCPQWTVRDLVTHLGGVHRWVAPTPTCGATPSSPRRRRLRSGRAGRHTRLRSTGPTPSQPVGRSRRSRWTSPPTASPRCSSASLLAGARSPASTGRGQWHYVPPTPTGGRSRWRRTAFTPRPAPARPRRPLAALPRTCTSGYGTAPRPSWSTATPTSPPYGITCESAGLESGDERSREERAAATRPAPKAWSRAAGPPERSERWERRFAYGVIDQRERSLPGGCVLGGSVAFRRRGRSLLS